MKWSIASNCSSLRPSSQTTRPCSTFSPGAGSFGPFIATSPRSGCGVIRTSRRSSRRSRSANRLDRWVIGEKEIPLGVDRSRFPDEGGGLRRPEVALEPLGPALELLGGRAMRTKGGVDLEDHLVGHARQLSRALEVGCELRAAGYERHLRLELERLRGRAHLRRVQPSGAKRVERELVQRESAGRPDQIGSLGPDRGIRTGIERHRSSLVLARVPFAPRYKTV